MQGISCEFCKVRTIFCTIRLLFSGISHASKIIPYRTWRRWDIYFQDFSFSIHTECFLHGSLTRKYENENVKLYSSNRFIFYIAATSRSSWFLVFCSKVDLRLAALVHSKFVGNRAITVISIRQWMKSLLLSFPPTVCRKCRSLKTILSNLSCSEYFQKNHRKKSLIFTSASNSKKDPPHRCFDTFFRTATFIKHFWTAVSVFPSTT